MLRIRKYDPGDWRDVCRVHDAARPQELRGLVPAGEIQSMAEVAEDDGFFAGETLVAEIRTRLAGTEGDGTCVVGFVTYLPPELTWLYVDPEFHGRGIGRRLVETVIPRLGPDGHVVCLGSNLRAVRLYESCGFVQTARFPGEVGGSACTCLRLCFPGSVCRSRPPTPTPRALVLAGFTDAEPGAPVRDAHGVWEWVRSR